MTKKKKVYRSKIQLTQEQILRLKEEISMQALVISVAAMADELKLTGEQIGNVVKRLGRYAGHLEEHRLRLDQCKGLVFNEVIRDKIQGDKDDKRAFETTEIYSEIIKHGKGGYPESGCADSKQQRTKWY